MTVAEMAGWKVAELVRWKVAKTASASVDWMVLEMEITLVLSMVEHLVGYLVARLDQQQAEWSVSY